MERTQALKYDTNAEGDKTGIACTKKEGRTIQSAADETDINTIVRRMGLGQLPPVTARIPMTGEFAEVFDFQSAMNLVNDANEAFSQLPANLRYRFNNNPGEFLQYMETPGHEDELRGMGILPPIPVATPEPPKDGTEAKKP